MLRLRNLLFVAIILAAFVGGLIIGYTRTSNNAGKGPLLAEFRILHGNLQSTNLSPQLREFLKSRIYYVSYFLNPADVEGYYFDFGPIDEKILDGAFGNKGPETQSDLYREAMSKHHNMKRSH